jgi:hypothetical protein
LPQQAQPAAPPPPHASPHQALAALPLPTARTRQREGQGLAVEGGAKMEVTGNRLRHRRCRLRCRPRQQLPRQMLVDEGAYFHAIDLSCRIPFLILNYLVTSY